MAGLTGCKLWPALPVDENAMAVPPGVAASCTWVGSEFTMA